ncbi:hypothetical protein ACN28S_07610 [Cystobacter fuscus]
MSVEMTTAGYAVVPVASRTSSSHRSRGGSIRRYLRTARGIEGLAVLVDPQVDAHGPVAAGIGDDEDRHAIPFGGEQRLPVPCVHGLLEAVSEELGPEHLQQQELQVVLLEGQEGKDG